MLYALDKDGKRVHINKTYVKYDYFCPVCGEKLVLKKGDIKAHHFSHPPHSECTDSWHYDMSDWHINWQEKFPEDTREIVKSKDGKKHRADILIEDKKIVIEFQHSPLSVEEFEDRNSFYNDLGYKVYWVFDCVEEHWNENIYSKPTKQNLYVWKRPRKTISWFDVKNKEGNVIYLQLEKDASENEELQEDLAFIERTGIDDLGPDIDDYIDCHKDDKTILVRVSWTTPDGFERFMVDQYLYANEFLSIFGIKSEDEKFSKDDIYDIPQFLYSKDHTSYYYGCTLSSTHKCIDSIIDTLESEYSKIMPCQLCKHHKIVDYENVCIKRFENLLTKEFEVLDIRRQDGMITSISVIHDNKKYDLSFEKNLPSIGLVDSITTIWNLFEPKVAIFQNINTNLYFKITYNPEIQLKNNGECLGYMSDSQFSFSKNKEDRVEVFYVRKKIWKLVWMLK